MTHSVEPRDRAASAATAASGAQFGNDLGTWSVPHLHEWKQRRVAIEAPRRPIITKASRIATIGSCFASEIAAAMDRLGLNGAMHPAGLFYTTRSIRQEMERIFGGWPGYRGEPAWNTSAGFVQPFKNIRKAFPTAAELAAWSDAIDAEADALFKSADVVVITLGLIEAWRNRTTGNYYRQIPHPQVFPTLDVEFRRLTVADMLDDLHVIRRLLRAHTRAEIILTVSPVPLHATFTPLDIRVANTESKARIRATVSQFIDECPDVHYFHSYEIVTTAERLSDFMLEDGRHVSRPAVDYILQSFVRQFATDDVPVPNVDSSWITPPAKLAAKPQHQSGSRLPLHKRLWRGVRRRFGLTPRR